MKALINYLLQYGQLSQVQIVLVKSKAKKLILTTGKYFSEAGKVAKQVAFVTNGILRVTYYNHEGLEITKYFIDENNFAVDLNSYTSKLPSTEYIQAVTDCTLTVFSADALKDLSLTIIGWDNIIGKITEKSLVEKVQWISPMIGGSAKEKYLNLLERFTQLANRIPLSMRATYLVTQSSLSWIRRNI
ncbi:MAG TPA: cyclic nucleotide-binding domain-containing protein [Marivirga sp.]|nr:cyclic nucleotide-binding domain-containing protein [Marivirga sp.]